MTQILRYIGVFRWVGYGLSWWCLIWPLPYDVVMVSCFAYCVFVLLLGTIASKHVSLSAYQGRATIDGLALFPSIALGLRILWDIDWFDWKAPLLASLVTGLVLSFVIRITEPKMRFASFVLFWLFATCGSFGAIGYINTRFETAISSSDAVTIIDKSIAQPKSTSYQLFLEAWHNRQDGHSVFVPKALHQRLSKGDEVCLSQHHGLLGFDWVETHAC